MAGPYERPGIGELLGDLSREVSTLISREIQLARAEISSGVGRLARGAAMVGLGGTLLHAGLLLLLAAAVLGLVAAGVYAWLASLIVAAVVLVIGGVLASTGLNRVKEADLAPQRTVGTLRDDVELVKETVSGS